MGKSGDLRENLDTLLRSGPDPVSERLPGLGSAVNEPRVPANRDHADAPRARTAALIATVVGCGVCCLPLILPVVAAITGAVATAWFLTLPAGAALAALSTALPLLHPRRARRRRATPIDLPMPRRRPTGAPGQPTERRP
jgi:hypothetical protein